MPGALTRIYNDFSGGQNNFAGPFANPVVVDNGDLQALQFAHESTNWEMSENGLLKYVGSDNVLTSALSGNPVVTGLYDWNGVLILCGGGKVYTVSGTSATQIYTGHTAGKYYQFSEWSDGSNNDILIMCNGHDTPLYYDGTTCTTITFTDPSSIWNNAKPKGAEVFRGRIFYWGDPTYPHRVYTPQPGTHNNFNNSGSDVDSFEVEAGKGGDITGLRAFTDDFLVVYKTNCIRRLEGTSPFGIGSDQFRILHVTDSYGCKAPRTICGNDLEQYFLAGDGLRKLAPTIGYGDVQTHQPTYPIQDIINDLNRDVAGVLDEACAVYDSSNKQVILSVPYQTATTNNRLLHYDITTGGCDPRSVHLPSASPATYGHAASVIAKSKQTIYHGDYAGQIYRHGAANSFDGNINNASWESKWIAHLGIGSLKIYRELWLFAEADADGDIIVQWQILRNDGTLSDQITNSVTSSQSVWDTGVWDTATWASGENKLFKIKNLGKGRALKLKFVNNSTSQRPKIRQVQLFYDVLGTAKR